MSCFVFYLKLSIETLVDFQYPESGKVVQPKPDQPDLFRRPCDVMAKVLVITDTKVSINTTNKPCTSIPIPSCDLQNAFQIM